MTREELLKVIAQAKQRRQTSMYLLGEQLKELPPEIGQLTQLTSLYLSGNQLTTLPEAIEQLTQLTYLNLSYNQLTTLPEAIGQLTQLISLDLSSNQLTTLPEAIEQLTQLTYLNLTRNQLTTLPEAIEQLTQLTYLILSGNQLATLPEAIEQLTQLTSLDLSSNQLATLPEAVEQLTQLISLNLSGNQLTTLPEAIEQLTQLTSLGLSGNQLTTLPEAIEQLTQLTSLDLSSNQLATLPEAIEQLTQLTSLGLSGNQLTTLPEAIGQLTQLTYLNLSGNQLTTLPEAIGQLTQLTSLNLSGNQLTTLPEAIGQLTQLTSLNLSGNQLTTLPEAIGQLTQLTYLNLSGNQLTTLPEAIGQLTQLTYLILSGNQLTTLPEAIGQLTQLTDLNLSGNQLTTLLEAIGQLTQLTDLNLSGNQLTTLPEAIGQLTQLTYLILSGNQLTTLPEAIGQLTQLKALDLSGNKLMILPLELTQLKKLKRLDIRNNDLGELPPEVRRKYTQPEPVFNFLRQLREEGTDRIYEAKLLIVGEGGAGKTSLANKLINPNYQLKLEGSENPEKSTEGIDVLHLDFNHSSGNPFRINLWDFGGQEIYHETHQFFLTKRSLYLLVADTRQDNTNFNDWLEIVELLSGASPVLIIKNEKQDRPCQVNENQLRGRFPNLEKILATNLSTNRGLPDVRAAIQHYISQLPHVGTPLPKTWVNVRKALEADLREYISQNEFLSLCDTHGFKHREDKLQLSGYLHDIGVCLHFQDDPVLKHTVILAPEWGTAAVYKVLDTKKVHDALGCFTQSDLDNIWSDAQYDGMRDELLQLMMRFKLCYEIPHRPKTYIAPQLLSPNQPEYSWDDNDNLILRYRYEFMPKGMLTRFIVEMHKLIDGDLVWKDGVILKEGGTRAEVIEARYRNEIRIRVCGFPKKDLLTRIRHEFDKIHASYNKPEDPPDQHRLRFQEFIPCNCSKCKGSQTPFSYPLNRLQERLKNNRRHIECDDSYERVEVRSLIDDILRKDDSSADSIATDMKIFISYSQVDSEWLTKLQTHLKPLVRKGTIDPWDDTRIRPSAEWRKEIETALAAAQVAVLLVSPNFLASDFIANEELPVLLDAAEAQGVKILWIPISYSMHNEAEFGKYQAAHNPKQPLASLPPIEQDRVLVEICQEIKRLATEQS